MTAQAASRHAVLGLALFLATACGRGADSGRRPSLTASPLLQSPRSRQQRPCVLRRSLHCDQHQPARQKLTLTPTAAPSSSPGATRMAPPQTSTPTLTSTTWPTPTPTLTPLPTATAIPTIRPAIQTTAAANVRPFKPNAWSAPMVIASAHGEGTLRRSRWVKARSRVGLSTARSRMTSTNFFMSTSCLTEPFWTDE